MISRIVALSLCALLIITFSPDGLTKEIKRQAVISRIEGSADVKYSSKYAWIPAKIAMILNEGDSVRTKKQSTVILNVDGTGQTAVLEMTENSQLLLPELRKDDKSGAEKTLLGLSSGKIIIKANKLDGPESRFQVRTPTAVVGVRGTKFEVEVEAED